ncbi:MAG: lactate utilization protein [Syntrophobacterales bacterium]|nr:MAG: lactate utilization protein [Syntrophobacterales bacterium]
MNNPGRRFTDFKKIIYGAVDDEALRSALRKAVRSFRENRDKALNQFPHVEEQRKILMEKKEEVLTHLDEMIEKFGAAAGRMGIKVHMAETVQQGQKILKEIVGSKKLIVKGKSITSEELGLNDFLKETGNEVFETDLGEFIVQLLGGKPMHLLAPAVNVPRERVAQLFSELAGRELPPDPAKLTRFARDFLREKFFQADIGMSGANAITADTGSIFLIENEGNIRFATNAPPVHIAVVGLEKILPTLADGTMLVEVASRYAGYYTPSYVSIISGPSKTGDIEKVIVWGVHGPREVHVILLDNGRREVARDPMLRQVLSCIRCGACMYECAVYPIVSGYWGHTYMGGIGIPWTALIAGGWEVAAPMAYTCTLCGRCREFCPMEIGTPEIVERLREEMAKRGCLPEYVKEMAQKVLTKGNAY